ncbi:FecR family protein [Zunongwangia atlantica]|uniref:Anti-sigma factor n=1 Tax=Zunongwangia atlantica 22II14-10F7 TaxID=1185767 RepID=A0A1Y1T8L1_9FLAO|nr:FecR domain-containing protein [Zunongwangia atlantica]ORL47389.1 anti-sigma factor [Zunongwangia atlantica 22II14-10F7]
MKKKSNFFFSEEEKETLKRDIIGSAESVKSRERNAKIKKVFGYAAVACVIGIIATIFYSRIPEKTGSDIERFVQESSEGVNFKSDQVTILLEENQINLSEDSTEVAYSANGDQLTLGNGKSIQQNVNSKNKSVFNTIIVPYGKRGKLTLSDGTQVWLNSGSRLVYPLVFSEDKREVYLQGEAIFDVAHNKEKAFNVLSDNQEISVLGTVFNVSVYPGDDEQQTVLKEGSVVVTYKEEKKQLQMVPGDFSEYNIKSKKITTRKVDPDVYFSWRNGELTLNRTDLSSIIKKLSRYYNVEILIKNEDLQNETFSGKLDLKETLGDVLNTIKNTSEFQYEYKNNDTLVINR